MPARASNIDLLLSLNCVITQFEANCVTYVFFFGDRLTLLESFLSLPGPLPRNRCLQHLFEAGGLDTQ